MSMTRLATVLLADDHIVFTDGIVRILREHFDVVGTVRDGSSLVEAATRLRPDVIVSDISMPTLSGFEGLRQLKAHHIESRMIFLTMHADAKLAAEAFRLGARAFVLKQSSGDELVKAIQAVVEGHKYMSAALTCSSCCPLSSTRARSCCIAAAICSAPPPARAVTSSRPGLTSSFLCPSTFRIPASCCR
jgi:DNA-binding NarL/FixJ family response regulator